MDGREVPTPHKFCKTKLLLRFLKIYTTTKALGGKGKLFTESGIWIVPRQKAERRCLEFFLFTLRPLLSIQTVQI